MDEPIFRLPPDWQLSPAIAPLAEVVDPFKEFLGVADLQKKNAGTITTRPLVFAVLDTGVDADHRDLDGQLVDAADFTDSIWGEADQHGHGTWCAGVIAAKADTFGIRGVAYEGKLLCAKVLGDNGSGTESMIGRGLDWAYSKGADFFSLSLGGGRMSESLHKKFVEVSQQKGKFILAAAGNDGGPVNYPAAWDDCVIAVGAADGAGKLTRFTSRGKQLDIVAPGVDILSTIPGNRHATMTGTSMATPIAAAIAGLVYCDAANSGHAEELDNTLEMIDLLRKQSRDDAGQYPLIDPRKLAKTFEPVPPPVDPVPIAPPADGVVLYAGGVAVKVFVPHQ